MRQHRDTNILELFPKRGEILKEAHGAERCPQNPDSGFSKTGFETLGE
jgi:hypothetical protein